MTDWKETTRELERLLKLRSYPVAYKKLDDARQLDDIPRVRRLDRFFVFCQLPGLVRTRGWTIGATMDDQISDRCSRLHGLADATQESMAQESAQLSTTWFATPEEAMKQQAVYPRIPKGEAIVLAPLASGKFDPDVVLIYGNPGQMMMIMSGIQKIEFQRFQFFYIGEGACADSLGQCYTTGKPALSIPCFGERRFGEVLDDEMVLALPPDWVGKAIEGMQRLSAIGLRLPVPIHGGEHDPSPALTRAYPKKD